MVQKRLLAIPPLVYLNLTMWHITSTTGSTHTEIEAILLQVLIASPMKPVHHASRIESV
jgi:hypothetical protein